MSQEILVNVTPKEVRVALLENGILQEIHIERSLHQGLVGNIYKGRVNRLLPGIQAAFVDIGLDRAAFLHISDMGIPTEDFSKLDIRDYLTAGKELLVQVYKDPLGSKGARLTTQFTIPSRYLVITPGIFEIAVSQKIVNEAERERMLKMIQPGPKGGYIFRTLAEGISSVEIERDKEFLTTVWQEVEQLSQKTKACNIVYEEIPIVLRALRDLAGYDLDRIRVDNAEAAVQMREFAARYIPSLTERIEYYSGSSPIFDIYKVEEDLQKALERKVPLKSGGHLIFDQTEAMTTIDVNTGSYVGHGNLEQTIFNTNLEAIDVIARQVRLRNLGGIIIIDFIDMNDADHKEKLLDTLAKALANDSAKIQISELSSLGLVQMTRKRSRESLEHILCATCPLCQRRGSVKSLETMCSEIFRELQRVALTYPWTGFTIVVAPVVAQQLLNEESVLLADLEVQLGKPIKLQVEPNYTQEKYYILPSDAG